MSDSNPPPHLAAHADRYREDPRRAALDWFREAGSGLFMHYGPSALHGKGDWGMYNRAIPVAEYEQLAERFTAEDFDADFITDLACEAEARYVNLTTKHHDGFLLWDSANESYNVANSAARRDLVGELAEQCRRKGLGFFCYYSYALDWHHPWFFDNRFFDRAQPDYPEPEPSYRFREAADFRRYIDDVHAQLTELLTGYGPMAGVWFDPEMACHAQADLFPIEETTDITLDGNASTAAEAIAEGRVAVVHINRGKVKYADVLRVDPLPAQPPLGESGSDTGVLSFTVEKLFEGRWQPVGIRFEVVAHDGTLAVAHARRTRNRPALFLADASGLTFVDGRLSGTITTDIATGYRWWSGDWPDDRTHTTGTFTVDATVTADGIAGTYTGTLLEREAEGTVSGAFLPATRAPDGGRMLMKADLGKGVVYDVTYDDGAVTEVVRRHKYGDDPEVVDADLALVDGVLAGTVGDVALEVHQMDGRLLGTATRGDEKATVYGGFTRVDQPLNRSEVQAATDR